MDLSLFEHFLRAFPFQPAVAFWRADEMTELLKIDFPKGKGFDLGCGDGKITRLLLDNIGPRDMVGLDIDPRETRLAEASGVYERVHTGSADTIPEPDNSFDFVFSNCVLEHIPNLEPVFGEVSRILKPNGLFIFTVPSEHYQACMRGPLLPWVSRERYLKEMDDRQAHFHYKSPEQWAALMNAHALDLHSTSPYLLLKAARRWETMSRFTGGLVYNLFEKRKRANNKHLLDYQYQFGLRDARFPMPKPVAAAIVRICNLGVPDQHPDGTLFAGRIVVGKKKG